MNEFFVKARGGEVIDLVHDERFQTLCMQEIRRSRKACYLLNKTDPTSARFRRRLEALFQSAIDKTTFVEPSVQIDYGCQMRIGKGVFIGNGFSASAFGGIDIEDGAQVGLGCTIATVNHFLNDLTIVQGKGVRIGKGAWIGANVTIVPGVTIGEGAVIGAGSVVTHDVPPRAVAVGNPARVVKTRPQEEL